MTLTQFHGRRWISLLAVAFLVAGAAAVALVRPVVAADDDAGTDSLVGKPAPDFTLETMEGKKITLSEQKGSVVVLDFWATWCPPCRKSLPHIQEMSQKKDLADNGLKVFAVNASEEKEKVEAFLKKSNYTFAVPLDAKGETGQKYLVTGIPTTVVVGRDGKVSKVFVGFGPDSAKQLDDAVDAALAEKAAK